MCDCAFVVVYFGSGTARGAHRGCAVEWWEGVGLRVAVSLPSVHFLLAVLVIWEFVWFKEVME